MQNSNLSDEQESQLLRDLVDLQEYLAKNFDQASGLSLSQMRRSFEESCSFDSNSGSNTEQNRNVFLKKILLPEACEKQRIKIFLNHDIQIETYQPPLVERFLGLSPNSSDLPHSKEIRIQTLSQIKTGLKKNESSILTFCVGFKNKACFGAHSIVVAGIRWHEGSGCQLLLRNSWGEDAARFQGWVSIDGRTSDRAVIDFAMEVSRWSVKE